MQVTKLDQVAARPRHVAVGEFDGVHLGHREVIAGNDTVLTFEPHPQMVVRPDRAPKLLTSLEVKTELIAGLGVAELIVIPFDKGFAAQQPQEFIDAVLVDKLGATHVSVGENFHFGYKAAGNPELLKADPRFETRVVPLVGADGTTISSTRIRGLLADGDVRHANALLGDRFRLRGEVVHGEKRGRELGFPTANLVPGAAFAIPGHGVYACRAVIGSGSAADPGKGGESHAAAVSIGVRPTFGSGLAETVEAYLLDYHGDLYGKPLTLEFFDRLRGEEAFGSVDELVAQMTVDVAKTRQLTC